MPNPNIRPLIKHFLTILLLFCAFPLIAQRNIDVISSPVATLGSTTAQVTSINTLSDSIVFVEVKIVPSSDNARLSNGISPETVMLVGDKSYSLNNVAQVMPGSMFPLQNPDGFQGWYDAKANDAHYLIMTFVVPTISTAECISIFPSQAANSPAPSSSSSGSSSAAQEYYSFPNIKINPSASSIKAFETTVLKSTKLFSCPSAKSKKLAKLSKGESVCIIEGDDCLNVVDSEVKHSDPKNDPSKFYKAVVLSSGICGYVEKDAVSQRREPIELLKDAVKLSRRGDANNHSDTAEIKFHNTTLTPVTIVSNDARITIDPLKTQTFNVRVESSDKEALCNCHYLVVSSEGLPPMIVGCRLNHGDRYHWEFVRASGMR